MVRDLAYRKGALLNIIVGEFIATAAPVASETIFRNYQLGVSPATIRNDMAYLEERGYIARPHTSAGSIPLDKGYRYYVESLTEDIELPLDEQYWLSNLFHGVEEELERWLKLAAAAVARLVKNATLVTFPRSSQCRFRHLELVAVHEFLALLVLVLSETILRQQLLPFTKPVNQEQLSGLAGKLNATCSGLTVSEISAKKLDFSPEENRLTEAVMDIMAAEDEMAYDEPYLEGLRLMLDQPEFAQKDKMLSIMELMEAKSWLSPMFSQRSSNERVQVMIGEENSDKSLQGLSLVSSRYGIPQRVDGTIVVIGPTRMDYRRAISTVSYMSEVLSTLVAEVYRGN